MRDFEKVLVSRGRNMSGISRELDLETPKGGIETISKIVPTAIEKYLSKSANHNTKAKR